MSTHVYNYNMHSEKKYFLGSEHRNLYDIIFINGNVVSHTPAGIAAFLATAGKEFYIDPQTHIFQHSTIHLKRDISDTKKGEEPYYEFKPSIIRLAKERLGQPFSSVIDQDRPLLPSDFINGDGTLKEKVIVSVCEQVINFQKNTIIDSLDAEEKEFLNNEASFPPKFILAPYFYLSPTRFEQWLRITAACYKKTKKLSTDLPVYFVLVISKEAIDSDSTKIAKEISKLKVDGIILWIDDHQEENLSLSEQEKFIGLIKSLRNSTENIINSRGGYFSTLLCHEDIGSLLTGVGHGINYGESRSVVPIGGGIPMAWFYFPSIHIRTRFRDALGIVKKHNWLRSIDEYRKIVCSCLQCTELIEQKNSINEAFFEYGRSTQITFRRRSGTIVRLDYPTKEAKQVAARHYLFNKAKEVDDIKKKPLTELLRDLEQTYNQIDPISGDDVVTHLNTWRNTIQKVLNSKRD